MSEEEVVYLSAYDFSNSVWESFKDGKYKDVKKVIKPSARPGDGCRHHLDLKLLTNLPKLEELDIAFETTCFNLEALASLPRLRVVKLGGVNKEDFQATPWEKLGGLGLQTFSCSSEAIKDTSFLPAGWKNTLTELSLNESANMTSLEGVGTFSNLTVLDVSSTAVVDFKGLGAYHQATAAALHKVGSTLTPRLPSVVLDLIANFAASIPLRELRATHLSKLESVQGLQAVPYLERLSLSYARKIVDLTPVAGLSGLSTLRLSGAAEVPLEHLYSVLQKLPELTDLDLWDCKQVKSLATIIPPLVKLQCIMLWGTQVTDLSPLLLCKDLKYIHASTNGDPYDTSFRSMFPRVSCNNDPPLEPQPEK